MEKRKWTKEEIEAYRKANGRLLYFNREDSNLFVPKAYGYGRTFNWAHPVAWLLIAALVGLILWRFL